MGENTRELSLGERRIRTKFNVSGDTTVDSFKLETAKLIDRLEGLKGADGEQFRLIALAQTAYEEAAMWAVKAATI